MRRPSDVLLAGGLASLLGVVTAADWAGRLLARLGVRSACCRARVERSPGHGSMCTACGRRWRDDR